MCVKIVFLNVHYNSAIPTIVTSTATLCSRPQYSHSRDTKLGADTHTHTAWLRNFERLLFFVTRLLIWEVDSQAKKDGKPRLSIRQEIADLLIGIGN